MPQKRVSMRKIREVLRLNHLQLSTRQIAESCRISKSIADEFGVCEASASALFVRLQSPRVGEVVVVEKFVGHLRV